ncbi:hypothetical protein PWT90_02482 [Aphanocladium album]|nr:hypothetical protein PWT90_02482 [Aphanocladium album]
MATLTANDECAEYLQSPGFHRSFLVPATPNRDALNISYSDLGRQNANDGSTSPPVLFFMPGMHATRFQSVLLHIVGAKMGVRILTVDRFGFGKTPNVPLGQRLSTWVEIVPLLLAHLEIQHVALASHTPFVDVKHSGVKFLQAAQLIPNAAIGYFDKLIKSLDTYVGPVVRSSVRVVDKWFPSAAQPDPGRTAAAARWETEYGIPKARLGPLLVACFRAAMAENSEGLNDETRLCLKRGTTWDACDDYDNFVKALAARETAAAADARLRVKVFLAQQDALAGERGKRYMRECWERNCGGETGQSIDVCVKTVDDTDHDSVLDKLVILEEVMRDVLRTNGRN